MPPDPAPPETPHPAVIPAISARRPKFEAVSRPTSHSQGVVQPTVPPGIRPREIAAPSRRARRFRTAGCFGGKTRASQVGRWVASLLPPVTPGYAEPFAGMAGVLLQRPPAKIEMLNDLDGRIVNWWRAVRERPEDMARLVALTPHGKAVMDHAAAREGAADPLERAWATHVVLQQSFMGRGESWKAQYCPRVGAIGRWTGAEFAPLAERLARVQLHKMDGVEFIRRFAAYPDVLLYCDPPYSGRTNPYRADVDRKALAAAILAHPGPVAISGTDREWDALGWDRQDLSVRRRINQWVRRGGSRRPTELKSPPRVEHLWRNPACVEAAPAAPDA